MTVLTDNLISYWKLDGDALDATATHNDGTPTAIVYDAVDFYSELNYDNDFSIYSAGSTLGGQSFTCSTASTITGAKFWLKKTGSPTGNAVAKLYSHKGTYGTSSLPDQLLATSDTFDVSTLSGTYGLKTLALSGGAQYLMSANTHYVITFEYSGGDISNYVLIGSDISSPTASGNCMLNTTAYAGYDILFYVNGTITGKINQGAGFNGTTSKIDLGNGLSMEGLATMSWSGWIKLSGNNAVAYPWIYATKNSVLRVQLGNADNTLAIYCRTANNSTNFTSTGTLTAGQWYFITIVYDGANTKLYIDGTYNSQGTNTGNTLALDTSTSKMGFDPDQNTYFTGSIDEVGIWSRALTSGEVTSLYNGGNGLAYPLTVNNSNMFLMF